MKLSLSMSLLQTNRLELVEESVLYKEFLAEREEILRTNGSRAKKPDHDIGFEKALLDWIVKHRSYWRTQRCTRRSR